MDSWKIVDDIGSETVGVILFKNIFTIAPGALELFSFKMSQIFMKADL